MGDHEGVFSKAQFFLEPKKRELLVSWLWSWDCGPLNAVKTSSRFLGPDGHLGGQRGAILEL